MAFAIAVRNALAAATLPRSRALVARGAGRLLALTVALVYALISMVEGQMLIFGPTNLPNEVLILTSGTPWWNYPGVLAIAPNAVVALPFFPTVAMAVVSVGVGVGMTVAVVLGIGLARTSRARSSAPSAAGAAAGLTPAMIALVTLGACCSTTAAAAAGVGVVAQTSGTSVGALLANNWFLGVFQIGILWVSLVAQEQLLAVYGAFVGRPGDGSAAPTAEMPHPAISLRTVVGLVLRFALLVGGLTWSLAMFVGWFGMPPQTAGAGLWFDWIAIHQFLGLLAIAVALSPTGAAQLFLGSTGVGFDFLRGVLLVLALSLVVGTPPPISGWGIYGLFNELAGSLGIPSAWGAVAPTVSPGLGLALHWGFQEFALGGLLATLAAAPRRALAWLDPRIRAPGPSARFSGDVAVAETSVAEAPRAEVGTRPNPPPLTSASAEPAD
ncbi:MAG TPA: hypothetical protein VGV89_01115 [Thermoplasmata archaeon]|nr:hypothetical protein [Thermoplasmata archaeon]